MTGSMILGGVILVLLMVFYLHYKKMEEKRKLCAKMNKLWVDHIVYTRLVMTSTLDRAESAWGVKNKANYLARLMKNQEDLASMFGSDKASVQKLLEAHIQLAGDAISSVANTGAADLGNLYANADSIGAYLNKRLLRTDMKTHMKMHIDTLVAMIMDYYGMKDDTANTDAYVSATMNMSNVMCGMFL